MIQFKSILRSEPGVTGGGVQKYYASVHREQPVTLQKFVWEVSRASTLNRVDVHAAIQAFLELIPAYLADGKIVRLGEFGSFYATISSRGEETEEDVTGASIKGAKIRFRPGPEMKGLVNSFKYQKYSPLTVIKGGDEDAPDETTTDEAAA